MGHTSLRLSLRLFLASPRRHHLPRPLHDARHARTNVKNFNHGVSSRTRHFRSVTIDAAASHASRLRLPRHPPLFRASFAMRPMPCPSMGLRCASVGCMQRLTACDGGRDVRFRPRTKCRRRQLCRSRPAASAGDVARGHHALLPRVAFHRVFFPAQPPSGSRTEC